MGTARGVTSHSWFLVAGGLASACRGQGQADHLVFGGQGRASAVGPASYLRSWKQAPWQQQRLRLLSSSSCFTGD